MDELIRESEWLMKKEDAEPYGKVMLLAVKNEIERKEKQ